MKDDDELLQPQDPYQALGDQCGLSGITMRKALGRKPITWQTACRIAKHLHIMANVFRIKEDNRGRNKKKRRPETPQN